MSSGQYWWHRAMVVAYESLCGARDVQRLSSPLIRQLCQWLSIPEIGLRCTRDTIKAARRRFTQEQRNGSSYLVHTATPRSKAVSTPNSVSLPEGGSARDPMDYCEICQKPSEGGNHPICEILQGEQQRGSNADPLVIDGVLVSQDLP